MLKLDLTKEELYVIYDGLIELDEIFMNTEKKSPEDIKYLRKLEQLLAKVGHIMKAGKDTSNA